MKLYVFPPSHNARKPLIAKDLLGLDLETELLDLTQGGTHTPEYTALNPNELMPTLVDGDFVLWESNAISQYLCDQVEGQTLLPTDARGRADVTRWQLWETAHWQPACATLLFQNMVKGLLGDTSGPDPDIVADGTERVHRFAKVANTALEGREWLVGDGLTLADISVGVFLTYQEMAKLPLGDYAELQRLHGQLLELDAWQAALPQIPAPAAS
ncbi:MAG: glutathione S-transferase family protein [Thermoanaerobaculia bacterium]|nr:glutathione S-transferase family protein [Thermoanaerobaculia bacterium]